jgi:hypothetical protein
MPPPGQASHLRSATGSGSRRDLSLLFFWSCRRLGRESCRRGHRHVSAVVLPVLGLNHLHRGRRGSASQPCSPAQPLGMPANAATWYLRTNPVRRQSEGYVGAMPLTSDGSRIGTHFAHAPSARPWTLDCSVGGHARLLPAWRHQHHAKAPRQLLDTGSSRASCSITSKAPSRRQAQL